jgi:hypothetical protein
MKQHLLNLGLRLALLLALLGAAAPAGTAHAADATGFLTFETGSDSATIELPGISFANDAGDSWRYGDVRTRRYNAPFPQGCADRPANIATPVCQYAVGENMFAWTGVTGGSGRFDFTEGDASFVAFDLAAGARANVVAYSAADRPIAAASVLPDRDDGNRGAVQLDAPAGERIAYVVISGATNFWLLDNLATDAPGVPDQRSRAEPSRAVVTVVQRAALPAAALPGGAITLTITAMNRGPGAARQTVISMPLDPARVRVLDASFSASGAWVSRLDADRLELQTGPLAGNGGVVTATLRLAILDTAPAGGAIGQQLSFRWADNSSGGRGRSNTLDLAVGATATADAALFITPEAAPPGSERAVSSPSFAPDEPVSVWYNTPDGRAVELGRFAADGAGALAITIDDDGARPGAYSLVAYGHWTEFTAVTTFTVR